MYIYLTCEFYLCLIVKWSRSSSFFFQSNLCCFERLTVINQDSCRGFMLLWTLGSFSKHPIFSVPPPLSFSKCDWRDDSPFPPLWTIHIQYTFAARVISVSGWTIAQYRSPVQEVSLPFLPQWKHFNFDKESVERTGDLLRQAPPREWGRKNCFRMFSPYF